MNFAKEDVTDELPIDVNRAKRVLCTGLTGSGLTLKEARSETNAKVRCFKVVLSESWVDLEDPGRRQSQRRELQGPWTSREDGTKPATVETDPRGGSRFRDWIRRRLK